MKKIFLPAFLAVVMTIGCGKGTSPTDPAPPPPPPPPTPAPKFASFDVSPKDSIWYDSTVTFKWSTTNATSVSIGGNNVDTSGSFTTPSLTKDTSYTVTATGKGGIVSITVKIHVYSQRMNYLGKYGTWKMIEDKFCNVDSLNYPSAWHYLRSSDLDCNIYQYHPDNTGNGTMGSCGPYPGLYFLFYWSFNDNESKIHWPGSSDTTNDWTIDTLDATKLQWSQIKPDGWDSTIIWKDVQTFGHN